MPAYHWRHGETEEVDLIIELAHDDLCLIEFKLTANPSADVTQGINSCRKRYKRSHKAAVVSAAEECFWITPDVLHIPWSGL